MKEKTIKNLIQENKKVYVYLANEAIGNKFMLQAEQEVSNYQPQGITAI